jgi:hypothetical protein
MVGNDIWALGLLIGCNLLFGGVVLIRMAFAARHPHPRNAATASSRRRHAPRS